MTTAIGPRRGPPPRTSRKLYKVLDFTANEMLLIVISVSFSLQVMDRYWKWMWQVMGYAILNGEFYDFY